ncbi:MAG: M14 family zinc carboxypeptidase, partial [Actinomycetota bacterium]
MALKKRSFIAALASLLVLSLAPIGRSDTARPMIVRVHPESATQAALLMSTFDETHNHAPGEIELLLWPGDLARLDALGYEYEVVVADLFAHDQALAKRDVPLQTLPGPDRSDYRRLADYNSEMNALAKKHPGLVKVFEMKRPSLEGRTVLGVEIASNVKDIASDGRPIFYLDALHHAREWPASEYTMLFIHHLVEGYGKDKDITRLLRRARVIAIPIVNVDGFDYSRESLAQQSEFLGFGNGFEGYWRKNRRSLTGATVPVAQKNPDAFGVDPNRNYSYLWGASDGGSSGDMLDQTYRGTEPFSEPETKNVRDI